MSEKPGPILDLPVANPLNGGEWVPVVQLQGPAFFPVEVTVRTTTAKIAGLGVYGMFAQIYSEQLTVTAPNTLAHTANAPNGIFTQLIVNAGTYLSVGTSPAFSVSGNTITWSSANAGFSLATTDTVIALYTY